MTKHHEVKCDVMNFSLKTLLRRNLESYAMEDIFITSLGNNTEFLCRQKGNLLMDLFA